MDIFKSYPNMEGIFDWYWPVKADNLHEFDQKRSIVQWLHNTA